MLPARDIAHRNPGNRVAFFIRSPPAIQSDGCHFRKRERFQLQFSPPASVFFSLSLAASELINLLFFALPLKSAIKPRSLRAERRREKVSVIQTQPLGHLL